MEFYRPASFESNNEPEQAGTPEAAKKKKKTTRIPKATGILPKLETEENKQERTLLPVENTLETLFAREAIKEEKTDEEETAEDGFTGLTVEEADSETTPESQALAGEFADEALIITRSEAPQEGFATEAPRTVDDMERQPLGPPESLQDQTEPSGSSQPEEIITENAPTPEASLREEQEVIPSPRHYEAVPTEPTAPERHQMIDPSARYGETVQAERYRAETLEPVTREEVNRTVLRAEKRGTSRGVIAGTIFGYWLRGRRNRAELAETRQAVEKQGREIKHLKEEQAVAAERLHTLHRSKEELQKHALERASEKNLQPAVREKTPVTASFEAPATTIASAEAVRQKVRSPESQIKKPEILPENKEITEETYQAPAGRRVETSSWHRFEIDEKTGKLAENPELAYGQEFKKEQQQELLQRDAAQPHMAMQLGQAVVQGMGSDLPTAPSQPPAASRPVKQKQPAVSAAYIKQQLVRRTTNPVTWVIALAVVVVLFVFGILS